jgi:hypothetical protein
MEKLLEKVRVGIQNALAKTSNIAKLSIYGFTEEVLRQGLALYQEAERLYLAKDIQVGKQVVVTKELKTKFKAAYKYYMKYARLFRRALRKFPEIKVALGLFGTRRRTFMGKIEEASRFFKTVLENTTVFEKVHRFAVTPETMQHGLDLFEEIKQSNDYQEMEKGESQKSTHWRNEVFEQLYDWYGEFRIAARNAFEDDDPQELETMGIMQRSKWYRRKKKPTGTEQPQEEPQPEPVESQPAEGETQAG